MPVLKHGLLGDEGGVPGGSAALHKEDGWTAHKIHPHSDPKADIEICEAVHEAVGDDMKLMLDSMWAYEYDDTIRVGRAIEDLDYYWYEDPLAEEDLYSYVELTRNSASRSWPPSSRLAAATAWPNGSPTTPPTSCAAASRSPAALRRSCALCHLAEGFKMKCDIHYGGNSQNNVASLHVTMAVPNCESTSSSRARARTSTSWWGHRYLGGRRASADRSGARLRDRLGTGCARITWARWEPECI